MEDGLLTAEPKPEPEPEPEPGAIPAPEIAAPEREAEGIPGTEDVAPGPEPEYIPDMEKYEEAIPDDHVPEQVEYASQAMAPEEVASEATGASMGGQAELSSEDKTPIEETVGAARPETNGEDSKERGEGIVFTACFRCGSSDGNTATSRRVRARILSLGTRIWAVPRDRTLHAFEVPSIIHLGY